MLAFPLKFLLCVVLLLMALPSCKTERTVGKSRQEMDPIRKKFAGNYSMERDASGMVRVQSEKRSGFESKVFAGTSNAKVNKAYKTGKFATSEFKTKGFAGNKAFATKNAAETKQASRWQWPWKNRSAVPKDAAKKFDTGDGFATREYEDSGRTFATRAEPDVLKRHDYTNPALENIRSPQAGEGRGPSVGDVRSMIGKGE